MHILFVDNKTAQKLDVNLAIVISTFFSRDSPGICLDFCKDFLCFVSFFCAKDDG